MVRDGRRVIETMRWGFPPPLGTGSKAPVTNVRNTASAYWRPSIANKAGKRPLDYVTDDALLSLLSCK